MRIKKYLLMFIIPLTLIMLAGCAKTDAGAAPDVDKTTGEPTETVTPSHVETDDPTDTTEDTDPTDVDPVPSTDPSTVTEPTENPYADAAKKFHDYRDNRGKNDTSDATDATDPAPGAETDPVPGTDPAPGAETDPAPDAETDPVPSTDPTPETEPAPVEPTAPTEPVVPSTEPVADDPVAPENPEPDFDSVEAVAAVGGLKATVQSDKEACVVYIFDSAKNHGNPYDVTWDYGDDYNAYLDKVDWSLVFDADYYQREFPLLAVQYHHDASLLLKHFQTVGVHEGRQGRESFNVAAYKANCDKALRDAFGDNYECYYLYYMLHQDTESGVKTTGNYKTQLTQKLTTVQATELKWINFYRNELGIASVCFDSELAALAAYRAYMDCTEGWDDHDGRAHMVETGELYDLMRAGKMNAYCENKYTLGNDTGKVGTKIAALGYRNSEGHYDTMVNTRFNYVGCGNWFVSDRDYNWNGRHKYNTISFDVFTDTTNDQYYN